MPKPRETTSQAWNKVALIHAVAVTTSNTAHNITKGLKFVGHAVTQAGRNVKTLGAAIKHTS